MCKLPIKSLCDLLQNYTVQTTRYSPVHLFLPFCRTRNNKAKKKCLVSGHEKDGKIQGWSVGKNFLICFEILFLFFVKNIEKGEKLFQKQLFWGKKLNKEARCLAVKLDRYGHQP